MNAQINKKEITYRTEIRPGDVGYVIYMHGNIYKKEYEYDYNFERYVALGFNEFLASYNPEGDRMWLAEYQGKIVESIVIVGRSGRVAQLRYFVLSSEFRGLGIGKELMKQAMDFCKACGYTSVYLWTTSELHAAAHLYQTFGFVRTKQVPHVQWGKKLTEDCYDLSL